MPRNSNEINKEFGATLFSRNPTASPANLKKIVQIKFLWRTERLRERNSKVLEMFGIIVLNGGISSEKIMEIGFKPVMRNERKGFLGVAHYERAGESH